MTTVLYAGDVPLSTGGNVEIRAGIGNSLSNHGKVIITKNNANVPVEMIFEGSGTAIMGLSHGYYNGTLSLIVNENNIDFYPIPKKLNQLQDVQLTMATSGDILMYNGTQWINASSPVPLPTVETITASSPALVNPNMTKDITFIKTTGGGLRQGNLSVGSYNGQQHIFVAHDLQYTGSSFVAYRLNTVGIFTDAVGSSSNTYIDFRYTGQSCTIIWNTSVGSWFGANSGVYVV